MYIILLIMIIAAGMVLFVCGYYASVIRAKLGKNLLLFIPVVIAIFMINIIIALTELSQSSNWQ